MIKGDLEANNKGKNPGEKTRDNSLYMEERVYQERTRDNLEV